MENELRALLDNYFKVPEDMYKQLHRGTFVRYILKEPRTSPIMDRFVRGMYVKDVKIENGEPILSLSATYKSKKLEFVKANEIEILWKTYTPAARIELTLFKNSLREKNEEIKDLQERVKKLEQFLKN